MMPYVLYVLFQTSGITPQVFYTKADCEVAAAQIVKAHANFTKATFPKLTTVCVPMGKDK